MAARKRKRAAKPKRKAAPARKAKKTASKSARRPAQKADKKAEKTAKKRVKAVARNAKKATTRTARKTKGEGDYAASRAFLKDQSGFVEKNKAKIPAMGKAAEAALDGPEGAGLRDAEATAAARSRDTF